MATPMKDWLLYAHLAENALPDGRLGFPNRVSEDNHHSRVDIFVANICYAMFKITAIS